MKIELRKSFDSGFSLKEEDIRRIYSSALLQMKSFTGETPVNTFFNLRLKNHTLIETDSLDEILNEDNGGQEMIRSLTITLAADQPEPPHNNGIITISFDADVPSNAISYTIISDNKDWIYVTSSQIEATIAKVKTFSPSSSTFRRTLVFFTFAVLVGLLPLLFNLLASLFHGNAITIPPSIIVIGALIILLAIGINIGFYLFPSYNFYWGEYSSVIDRRRVISKLIIYSAVLAIVIGILANIIIYYLTMRFGGGGSGG